jgi:hypothetical protein
MDSFAAEVTVLRRAHQLAELLARQPQQTLVVAGLDVNDLAGLEFVIDHGLHAPGHAERRHRTMIAVGEARAVSALLRLCSCVQPS